MQPVRIIHGDARRSLKKLKDQSVHCIITSPPYYALRNYEVDGQIGLESTPDEYIRRLVRVFREARRVLRDDGVLFVNIGDSFSSGSRKTQTVPTLRKKGKDEASGKHSHLNGFAVRPPSGLKGIKQKDRIGIPHMLAFALRADGWYFRDEIIWFKRNPMPSNVTDRCAVAHEFMFMFSKKPHYYYDYVAIMEKAAKPCQKSQRNEKRYEGLAVGPMARGEEGFNHQYQNDGREWGSENRIKRSVWDVPTESSREKHYAGFPRKLITPCILAGTSKAGCCPSCLAPYVRKIKKIRAATRPGTNSKVTKLKRKYDEKIAAGLHSNKSTLHAIAGNRDPERHITSIKTLGWKASCNCNAGKPIPCIICDPFSGTGTTAAVAVSKGRHAIAIDLNADYVKIIQRKVARALARKGFGL